MRRAYASFFLGVATALVTFAVDQLAKMRWLTPPESPAGFWHLHGWVQSVIHENHGITFNLPLPNILILLVTLAALGWILHESWREGKQGHILRLFFLGLILGGALGNAYDRLIFGYVRDWLLLWHRSAINFADISILVGAVGYFVDRFRSSRA